MCELTATYDPADNKLRLRSATRLDRETFERVKAAGFAWAPKQELFVAPMWTPARADLLIELCGEIEDEDTSLVDRAAERADRFEDYSDKRASDAERARRAVQAIADNIPLGQPILVGHHSEKHARKHAEKIEGIDYILHAPQQPCMAPRFDPVGSPLQAAQSGINRILQWLEKETGLRVDGLSIQADEVTTIRDPLPVHNTGVVIRLETPIERRWAC